jgi:membrane protein DedA with SNARE-associated domain
VTFLGAALTPGGSPFVVVSVLLQYAGIPIPAEPALIIAGSMVSGSGMDAVHLVASTLVVILAADALWFVLGRHLGRRLLSFISRRSPAVGIFVAGLERRSSTPHGGIGPLHAGRWFAAGDLKTLVALKLLPGFPMLAPAIAGAIGIKVSAFFLFDVIVTTAWSALSIGAGMLFSKHVDRALTALAGIGRWGGLLGAALLGAYLIQNRGRSLGRAWRDRKPPQLPPRESVGSHAVDSVHAPATFVRHQQPIGCSPAMLAGDDLRTILEKGTVMKTIRIAGTTTTAALSSFLVLAAGRSAVAAPAVAGGASTGEEQQTITAEHAAIPVLPRGFALQLGGGATGFSRQATRDLFGAGGYWDARAIFGSNSYLGAEVAYVGSARNASAVGLAGNPALVSNGAEFDVRANLPIQVTRALRVEPFVFGGLGWSYFQLVNEDSNRSSIKDHANALTVPFGAGASLAYDRFIVDARFTYRTVFDDKLVPMTVGSRDHADLQNWSAGLTLGYEL